MPTMTSLKAATSTASRARSALRLATAVLLLGGAATAALAQYKIVGPDGKVTYTDKPPTASDMRMDNGTPSTSNGNANGGMPFATRQAMAKYPVTLYVTKNCTPCDMARDALRKRGVPYSEFLVVTDADIDALKSRFGSGTLPVIAIGGQTTKGYVANELQSYLDAAGYPAQTQLTGYRWPQAVALAPPVPAATAAPAPATPAAPPAPGPLLPPPSKSGIQF